MVVRCRYCGGPFGVREGQVVVFVSEKLEVVAASLQNDVDGPEECCR